MEKIKETFSKSYPVLRLYKQDIESLYGLFKNNCENIDIVADGFRLNNISEISEINKNEITHFEISAHKPYIHLELSDRCARLYLEDKDDIKLRGLEAKVDEILLKRKSLLRFLVSFKFLISLGVLSGIFIGYRGSDINKVPWIIAKIFIVILTIIAFLVGYRTDMKKYSLIYLFDSSLSMNFFQRNKDRIMLSIFSALIGGLIAAIVQWLMR